MMKKCKLTILKTTLQESLAKEYGVPNLSICPLMKEGQAFYADYAKPEDFCDEAWNIDALLRVMSEVKQQNGFANAELKSSKIGSNYPRRNRILVQLLPIDFRVVLFVADKQAFVKDTPLTDYKKTFIKYLHKRLFVNQGTGSARMQGYSLLRLALASIFFYCPHFELIGADKAFPVA